MPFVPVENYVHAAFSQSASGGLSSPVNDLYIRGAGAWDQGLLDDLVVGLGSWWETEIAPLQNSGVSLVEIKATDLTVEAGLQSIGAFSIDGTRAGTDANIALAAVAMFKNSVAGLPRHGLWYQCGFTEADVNSQNIEDTFRADLVAAFQNLQGYLTAALTSAYRHGIISRFAGFTIQARPNGTRYKKPTPRVTGISSFNPVYSVRQRVGVQKKRRALV